MLTRSIPQSGTGDQTVRRSPDPATDGLTDRMVRRLTDSSALLPAYALKISARGWRAAQLGDVRTTRYLLVACPDSR